MNRFNFFYLINVVNLLWFNQMLHHISCDNSALHLEEIVSRLYFLISLLMNRSNILYLIKVVNSLWFG
jgi:hypothetical protein